MNKKCIFIPLILLMSLIFFTLGCSMRQIQRPVITYEEVTTTITNTSITILSTSTIETTNTTSTTSTTVALPTTSSTITTTTTIDSNGTFNITITLVSPTNNVIDFGSYDETLDKNAGEILNVTANLTGATSYAWYLDGDALGVTTSNCSINSANYIPRVYNLCVVSVKNGLPYTGTIKIKIEN